MRAFMVVVAVMLALPAGVLAQDDEIGREPISCDRYGEMVTDDIADILEAINASDGELEGVYAIYALAIEIRRSHEDVSVPDVCEDVNYIMRAFFGGVGDWAGHLVMQILDDDNQDFYEAGLRSGDDRVQAARHAATGE